MLHSVGTGVALSAAAASIVLRTGAQAVCSALGRRKAERFLREWARLISLGESVRVIRPKGAARLDAEATREASAWLEANLPALIASLPPD
jgi:hypothetical protein